MCIFQGIQARLIEAIEVSIFIAVPWYESSLTMPLAMDGGGRWTLAMGVGEDEHGVP